MELLNIEVWKQMLADFGVSSQMVIYVMILLTTILLTLTLGLFILGTRSPLDKKLKQISETGSPNNRKPYDFSNTLESLSPFISKGNKKDNETYSQKLMHAGFHEKNALSVFYALKVLSSLVGIIAGFMVYYISFGGSYNNLLIMTCVFLGTFTPNIILSKLQKERQKKIRNGVPDALDLLVVCTESGLGFNAALGRVASELYVSQPELADELETVFAKIQAGVTMPDALRQFIDRTGLVELEGLVSLLSHASRMGGSLAQTLRDYTVDFRDKRQQAAEEIAAKIPTKMLFPMLLFIWPCFFIVALGPGIIIVIDALGAPGVSL
ncbi:type II secretion system F family protein [Vibrio sp. 10N.222.54.F12]|jgi:tight adherence protein C|uniref:Flp pilus assembly protein TadC n=2 Tax=Vibrio atlanticus TaxID=693153 RepID=B7VJD0_VIBA3|nr:MULTISPECIES: type II secretion system F family protein [Vibrio]MCZ4308875.1 type II secretion system F family protein [Vibrio atlanticus]OEF68083.1 pilus assembly protein TadC [Vibrio tasmaniensis 1F-155]OEF70606.1 pilus assembly protein TadC [Vibrio tasmaniensis 1F-187]PML18106.1 pilus assembly protein TadC [Vibrio tasmaniensis]PMO88924.1 pilus assembly protein TadC [Vibrio tasmaniensis]